MFLHARVRQLRSELCRAGVELVPGSLREGSYDNVKLAKTILSADEPRVCMYAIAGRVTCSAVAHLLTVG